MKISFSTSVTRLLNAILALVYSSHFIACAFFLVVWIEGEDFGDDFVPGGVDILSETIIEQYVRSLYWALTTSTGYCNTNPQKPLEVGFSLLVTYVGIVLLVTIVGSVGSLVAEIDASSSYFQQFMSEINTFMSYRKLPSNLQQKIRSYYTYLWKSRKALNEGKILEDLPIHLQIDIAKCLNSDIIKKVPLFHGVENQFINSIILKLRPMVAIPEVYIVKKGAIGREMFFISKGEVQVVDEQTGAVFATLGDGKFFGEVALIYNTRRNASIRAKTHCDLFIITKDDFNEVTSAFPEQAKMISREAKKRYAVTKK